MHLESLEVYDDLKTILIINYKLSINIYNHKTTHINFNNLLTIRLNFDIKILK